MATIFRPPNSGGTIPPASESDVTTRHPDWVAASQSWQRVSDVLGGTDAVRANARAYIPLTADQEDHPETYDAMIARTSFTAYTARAVDGLEGLIFRKDANVSVPGRYKPRLDNINNAGDSVNTFAKKATREVLSYGRVGILVDALPTSEHRYDSPVTLLPYLSLYTAANITNWRLRTIDGQRVADQIVLREYYDEPQAFGSIVCNRYRVLELDDENRYRLRIYEQRSDGGEFYLSSETYPQTGSAMGLTYLNRIPFIFINPIDLSPTVHRSPILDIVDANLAHFLLESEYASALFYSAQPTPVISGWQEGMPGTFRFGGGNLWLLPQGCTAEILEFHGHGLEPLEKALASKESQIAELGARLLQSAARGPETAEAARIRQHSQTSVVGSIARTVSDGLQAAIENACIWGGSDGKVSFELNQDYIDVTMDPQMLLAIGNAVRDKLLTRRDAVWNIQRGELTEPGRSVDQILGELETEKPLFSGRPDPAISVPRVNGAASNGTAQIRRDRNGKPQGQPQGQPQE
jgi:hypothetical protein